MRTILRYLITCFRLEIKKMMMYKGTFWIFFLSQPMWTLLTLAMIDIIFRQTNSLAGYSKYEMYILYGTFRFIDSIGFMALWGKLNQLSFMIRGEDNQSFDVILTKPLDAQILSTTGNYYLGNISQTFLAIAIAIYGFSHIHYHLTFLNVVTYLILVILGLIMYYITFLTFKMSIFWFEEIYSTNELWNNYRKLGSYPAGMYKGGFGIFLNFVIPVTLIGAIPTDFLLGRVPSGRLFYYIGIVGILFLFSRWFWKYSMRKYSSFSS